MCWQLNLRHELPVVTAEPLADGNGQLSAAERETFLADIRDQAGYMAQLIDDLLELSRTPRAGDALLGLVDGPVFVLVVARSAVMGVPAIEDGERLLRFEPALRAAFDA